MERGSASRSKERSRREGSKSKSGSYLDSKVATKEVEGEVLTLQNRIALLEKEEQKVLKRIEQAKKQATEIITKKNRNLKAQLEKEQNLTTQERELIEKREELNQVKEALRDKVKEATTSKVLESKEKAEDVKDTLQVERRNPETERSAEGGKREAEEDPKPTGLLGQRTGDQGDSKEAGDSSNHTRSSEGKDRHSGKDFGHNQVQARGSNSETRAEGKGASGQTQADPVEPSDVRH